MEQEYWREKRLGVRHVMSAWALVILLLAALLAVGELIGAAAPPDGVGGFAGPGQTFETMHRMARR